MIDLVDNFTNETITNKEAGEPRQETRKASAMGKKVKVRKSKVMNIDTTTLDS